MALAIWVDRRTDHSWREVLRTDAGIVTLRAGRWTRLNGQPIWADDHPTIERQIPADRLPVDYWVLTEPE